MNGYDLTINQIIEYSNKIFDLQYQIIKKDFQLAAIEFELMIAKQLLESYKSFSVKGELECK